MSKCRRANPDADRSAGARAWAIASETARSAVVDVEHAVARDALATKVRAEVFETLSRAGVR